MEIDIIQLTEDAENFLKYAVDPKQLENVRDALRNLQGDIRAAIGSVIGCISDVMKEPLKPSAEVWTFDYYKSKFKAVEDAHKEFSIGLIIYPFTKTFKKDLPTWITITIMDKYMSSLPKCTKNYIAIIIHAALLYIVFENEIRKIEKTIKHWPQGVNTIPSDGKNTSSQENTQDNGNLSPNDGTNDNRRINTPVPDDKAEETKEKACAARNYLCDYFFKKDMKELDKFLNDCRTFSPKKIFGQYISLNKTKKTRPLARGDKMKLRECLIDIGLLDEKKVLKRTWWNYQ